ncbi:MAG: acyl-CoA reductase [Luteolibacter sp.]
MPHTALQTAIPMDPSPTTRRIELLASQAPTLEPWLGAFTAADLEAWLADQLGDARALDAWIPRGGIRSRAVALEPVLHIISGNSPHAGFQSLFRGLLLGGRQRVKLPSAGLPPLEKWIAGLPAELAALVETSLTLPEAWRDSPVAVIFGDGETLAFFRDWCGPKTRRIEHGPKISAAILFVEPDAATLAALAGDILREDQRGCLSVQNVLCDAATIDVRAFAANLAAALDCARKAFPCPPRGLSDSGRIRNFRETLRYRAANGAPLEWIESAESTSWTVVVDATPAGPLLTSTLGGGTVIVRAFADVGTGPDARVTLPPLTLGGLGSEAPFLSTIVAHPFDDAAALARLDALAPPRICAPGMAQFPGLFWCHDGIRPLAALVCWRDLG